MSRGYDARRKAKRRQAQARAAAELPARRASTGSRKATVLLPLFAITGILFATAILGIGGSQSQNQKQIAEEVSTLLAGIPQQGVTLGSPEADTTIRLYTDLECPTVKRFVEGYLPSIIAKWVRSGALKLEYRSLRTDTMTDRTFFKQEEAARAAGMQGKMWNFALNFIRSQGVHFTEYATDGFLGSIASQVPGLDMKRWNRDRRDPNLFKTIALSIRSGRIRGFSATPSFVVTRPTADTPSVRKEILSQLTEDLQILRAQGYGDYPIIQLD